MNKLRTVREYLKTNPDVIIVKDFESNFLEKNSYCCKYGDYNVDLYVAPKNGLYTAEELQEFMMGLIPDGLMPTHKRDFSLKRPDITSTRYLQHGYLYFDEEIGKEREIVQRDQIITHEDLINSEGFFDGKRKIYNDLSKTLMLRTAVKPFVNEAYALDVLARIVGDNEIPIGTINKYNPSTMYSRVKKGLGVIIAEK